MFDKNVFKEQFRLWTEENPNASCEEAKKFCEFLIPLEYKEKFNWLEEESLAWFAWKKEMHRQNKYPETQDLEEDISRNMH
ncbi:hypothetical protein QEJ31_11285 [Pigmentibacter sp. JX0631]|uniref:hypothetical protein n=1 Tax=Pigmentibacter sp. JX0631 TaxID=2976982 RepID=UPI0024694ED0|nr:hypothetical protein [Pigmentibacter sp. JX0631]WGL59103.1 hypothetical protein QEJ31_11285 [Pigmentibacter sp. JX0631]